MNLLPSKGPSVQHLALAAVKSGAATDDIQVLASLGNFGRNENHVAGQITSRFCKNDSLDLPVPYCFEAPVLKKGTDSWYRANQTLAVFLPHEWFSWVEHHDNVSGFSGLQSFWDEHDAADPKLCKNPMKGSRHLYLPLVIHGDGGQFQKWDSITIISMRSLLSADNVASSQMLLAAIPKGCQHKSENPDEDTMTVVWKVLAWSFQHLYYGKFPEFDHLGKPWPAKTKRADQSGSHLWTQRVRGCLFCVTADGEFLQNELKLPGHSHNSCCFSCQANKSDIPHNDFRATAKWRSTLTKPGTPLPGGHPLGAVPGLNTFSVHYDTLHCLEEGVAAHALANTFFDLVVRGHAGAGTQDQNLQAVYRQIRQQYLEQGIDASHRIKKLSLTNFSAREKKYEKFPDLTGFKAKQIRYLVPVMAEILQFYTDEDDAYSLHRLQCLQNLNSMYELMDCGLHMGKESILQFKKVTDLCLLHFARCAKLAMEAGLLQWNLIHKHHLVAHMPAQAAYLNPKLVSTYSGETMVGFMASLAHACLNGSPPHLVPEKVLWRFRLGMWLKYIHGSETLESESSSGE